VGAPAAGEEVHQRVYDNAGNGALLALAPGKPGRALDCGCGAGANARLLSQRGWDVTGVTLSPGERERAAAHCSRVVLADLEEPLPDEVGRDYDLIVLSHVLEHLRRPEQLLARLLPHLAPSGEVLVALPNTLFYPIRLRALFGHFEYQPSGILDETHLRFFTFTTGAELLRRSGLRVLEGRAEGGFPLGPLRRVLPPAIAARIDAAASRSRPGLFGVQLLYRAVRA
jgi:2-polyprenyl-3-methyl-5-hydroxy-6-metoxy-1,4-benzoquinol methylase